MNQAETITLSRNSIQQMVGVLKNLNIVGYDSMYKLVATVEFLEGKLTEEQPVKEPIPIRRPPVQRREPVDHEFRPLKEEQ